MRNIILIIMGLVLTVLVSIGLFIYPTVRDTGLQSTGYVAKQICSGHFISGFSVDDILDEALRPIDENLASLNVDVDREARHVDVSAYGLFGRRAAYVDGAGCNLLPSGATEPAFSLNTVAFFAPPSNAPWPQGDGPVDHMVDGVDYEALVNAMQLAFEDADPNHPRNTKAVVVIWRGNLIGEMYADGVNQHTPLLSWSMAKSVTNAQAGILHGQERMRLFEPLPVPEWQGEDDPRAAITVDQVLRMSTGLAFDETYGINTDVTRMLAQEPDAGAFAASMPLEHEPGEFWSYSSGTTNILSRAIRGVVGGSLQDHYDFVQENLFLPLGANSFILEADASGTFIGSSYMYATARDWARLGQLYLQDGLWDGVRILPNGWVDYSRSPTMNNDLRNYGAHFWLNRDPAVGTDLPDGFATPMMPDAPRDAFLMNGFQGQHVVVIPSRDLVIVRLGFATQFQGAGMNDVIAGVIASIDD